MSTPKSVRITKAAREDMVDAVMREWEKQNPRPEETAWDGVLDMVAEKFVLTQEYRRTLRFSKLTNDMKPGDSDCIQTRKGIYVQVQDREGRNRDYHSVSFTKSQADARNLLGGMYFDYLKHRAHLKGTVAESDYQGEERIRVYEYVGRSDPAVIISNEDPRYQAIFKEERIIRKWEEKRKQLRSETRDLLNSFNTTKQLREGWPAALPFLPPHLADPEKVVNLPVPTVSRLNERLGISE